MNEKKVTRGKKIASQNGEMHIARQHNVRGVTVAKDHGTNEFSPDELCTDSDEQWCDVGAVVERAVQPEQYESLKVGVSCRFPCSVEHLRNGKSFKIAHEMCRKELAEQLARGLEGLESPFSKRR